MESGTTIHATCIACGGRAVLLRGGSGAGKSDLAFRMIRADASGETRLVADDQVHLSAAGEELAATAPQALAGLLELRGLGLLRVPVIERARVRLVADLVPRADIPRLPEPEYEEICGIRLPRIRLHAFDLTAADKLRLALEVLPDRGFPGEDGILGGA